MTSHSSTPAFFNEPAELAYLASCEFHTDPFYFPEPKVQEIRKTETIFNTSTLTFEEQQPDDEAECALMCGDETPNGRTKYLPTSCTHTDFICRGCVLRSLEANNRFNICPFCRNPNFCPRITRQTLTTIEGYTTKPITEAMINKYRKELFILERMKINGDYYRDNIHDKEFKDLTPYEQLYYNIHYAFTYDIGEERDDDIDGAYNFFIKGSPDAYGVPTVDNFNTPQDTSDLMSETFSIVARDADSGVYCVYSLNFMTRDDFAVSIADYLVQNPYSFSSSFIFTYLIQTKFKNALLNEESELWVQIIKDDDNEEFLRSMLKPHDELVENIEQQYIGDYWGDDINEIMGYEYTLDTQIKRVVLDRVIDNDIILCVERNAMLNHGS